VAHRGIPEPRLTVREWLRYRRYLGALVRADVRAGVVLGPDRISDLKDEARRAVLEGRGGR
jgi:hypothetical protein